MPSGSPPAERRSNHELREVIDDLITHVREIVQMQGRLAPQELEYAQQRLEWLADEVWRLAAGRSHEE